MQQTSYDISRLSDPMPGWLSSSITQQAGVVIRLLSLVEQTVASELRASPAELRNDHINGIRNQQLLYTMS